MSHKIPISRRTALKQFGAAGVFLTGGPGGQRSRRQQHSKPLSFRDVPEVEINYAYDYTWRKIDENERSTRFWLVNKSFIFFNKMKNSGYNGDHISFSQEKVSSDSFVDHSEKEVVKHHDDGTETVTRNYIKGSQVSWSSGLSLDIYPNRGYYVIDGPDPSYIVRVTKQGEGQSAGKKQTEQMYGPRSRQSLSTFKPDDHNSAGGGTMDYNAIEGRTIREIDFGGGRGTESAAWVILPKVR
ncbi:hypothetical protein [Haladaptatus sp. DFWS20]|uniref:hypothetical protein n=1 Tax=Haladaptatus sp. DFWS20 TaxID=3403467 RepID=UPI003EBD0A56